MHCCSPLEGVCKRKRLPHNVHSVGEAPHISFLHTQCEYWNQMNSVQWYCKHWMDTEPCYFIPLQNQFSKLILQPRSLYLVKREHNVLALTFDYYTFIKHWAERLPLAFETAKNVGNIPLGLGLMLTWLHQTIPADFSRALLCCDSLVLPHPICVLLYSDLFQAPQEQWTHCHVHEISFDFCFVARCIFMPEIASCFNLPPWKFNNGEKRKSHSL